MAIESDFRGLRGRVSSPGWWRFIAAVGLGTVVVGLFYPALGGRFVGMDDGNNIFLNPHMGSVTWERTAGFFSDFTSARRYMPVGWLGFSLVFDWQGLDPWGYHAASLAGHTLAAVFLFLTAYNFFGRCLGPTAVTVPRRLLAALLAGALWALHPLRTEAVAWASGLLYSQAAAFAFLCTWLWTLRWSAPAAGGWYAAGACLALALSLLTYPLALGMPVVCWLLDNARGGAGRAPETRPGLWERWQLSKELAAMVCIAGAALVATLISRQASGEMFAAMPPLASFGLFQRIVQALYVWGRYLTAFAFPADLAPVYTTLYNWHPPEPGVEVLAGLSGACLLATVAAARRHRAVFGWVAAYTAIALPVLGLTEHPWITHDRYAGLPQAVLCVGAIRLGLGTGLVRWFRLVAGGVVVAVLAGALYARSLIGVWLDPWTYNSRLEKTLPHDSWAGYYLGQVPASVLFLEGRFAEIPPGLARAESLASGWSAGPARAEFDGLIRQHQEFLRQNWPGRTLAPLAVLHFLHGKSAQARQDWATAGAHFRAARQTVPAFGEAWQEEAWCELELHHPAAAGEAMDHAVALFGASPAGDREREFWQVLIAVYRARGEARLAAETGARAQRRLSLPAGN